MHFKGLFPPSYFSIFNVVSVQLGPTGVLSRLHLSWMEAGGSPRQYNNLRLVKPQGRKLVYASFWESISKTDRIRPFHKCGVGSTSQKMWIFIELFRKVAILELRIGIRI